MKIRLLSIALMTLGIAAALVISRPKQSAAIDQQTNAATDTPSSVAPVVAPAPLESSPEPDDALRRKLAHAVEQRSTEDVTRLLALWVRLDPEGAAAFAERISPQELRIDALRSVGRNWATVAPTAAMAWAEKLNTDDDRQLVREFICYRVAEEQPLDALHLATEAGLPVGAPLVADLTQQWAEHDRLAATEWALKQSAGTARDQLIARIALVVSREHPDEAGQLVVDEIPPGATQDEAAISVLFQWAVRDAASATKWVAQFPAGPLRQRAEAELAGIAASQPESK